MKICEARTQHRYEELITLSGLSDNVEKSMKGHQPVMSHTSACSQDYVLGIKELTPHWFMLVVEFLVMNVLIILFAQALNTLNNITFITARLSIQMVHSADTS